MQAEKCPICLKVPEKWHESARFKSREIFWVGCKKDGILEGGYTPITATTNWNRRALRIQYEHSGASYK